MSIPPWRIALCTRVLSVFFESEAGAFTAPVDEIETVHESSLCMLMQHSKLNKASSIEERFIKAIALIQVQTCIGRTPDENY